MSSENVGNENGAAYSGSVGSHFQWDPVSKTVRAVNPSDSDPNHIKIGPHDTDYFTERRN